MKVKSEREVISRVRLLATPWTAAHQAPPSIGFFRQEYWMAPSKTQWILFLFLLSPVSTANTNQLIHRFSLIKYFYKEANTISELRKNHLQIDGNRIPNSYYSVMIIWASVAGKHICKLNPSFLYIALKWNGCNSPQVVLAELGQHRTVILLMLFRNRKDTELWTLWCLEIIWMSRNCQRQLRRFVDRSQKETRGNPVLEVKWC